MVTVWPDLQSDELADKKQLYDDSLGNMRSPVQCIGTVGAIWAYLIVLVGSFAATASMAEMAGI